VPNNTVIEVVQPGYVIADRMLRPAMVGVAKGGPKDAASAMPLNIRTTARTTDQSGWRTSERRCKGGRKVDMTPLEGLDYAGVAVFAATGALAASRKQLDMIGFGFLAAVTGIGGGTFRDIVLGDAGVLGWQARLSGRLRGRLLQSSISRPIWWNRATGC
jgi:hypothetical protein